MSRDTHKPPRRQKKYGNKRNVVGSGGGPNRKSKTYELWMKSTLVRDNVSSRREKI